MKVEASTGSRVAVAIGSLAVMLALMFWSYVYPYPNDKVPDLSFFVIFWFKEIILLVIAALVFLVTVAGWVSRYFRARRPQDAEST
jgi:hypothetical protein